MPPPSLIRPSLPITHRAILPMPIRIGCPCVLGRPRAQTNLLNPKYANRSMYGHPLTAERHAHIQCLSPHPGDAASPPPLKQAARNSSTFDRCLVGFTNDRMNCRMIRLGERGATSPLQDQSEDHVLRAGWLSTYFSHFRRRQRLPLDVRDATPGPGLGLASRAPDSRGFGLYRQSATTHLGRL